MKNQQNPWDAATNAEVEPLEAVGVSYECWRRYGDSTYFVVLGRGVALGRLDLCVFCHGWLPGAASQLPMRVATRGTLPSFVHECEWTCLRLLARPKTDVASERAFSRSWPCVVRAGPPAPDAVGACRLISALARTWSTGAT